MAAPSGRKLTPCAVRYTAAIKDTDTPVGLDMDDENTVDVKVVQPPKPKPKLKPKLTRHVQLDFDFTDDGIEWRRQAVAKFVVETRSVLPDRVVRRTRRIAFVVGWGRGSAAASHAHKRGPARALTEQSGSVVAAPRRHLSR